MRSGFKRLVVCFVLLFAISLLGGPVLYAQEGDSPDDIDLPEPGLLPGSPFYFVKRLFESLRLGLTRPAEERAAYIAHLLEVRLAEAEALAGKGRAKLVERTLVRYQELAVRGTLELERAAGGGGDMTGALLALEAATRKSEGVLNGVTARVPEQAQSAIRTALQAANHGRETCLRMMERVCEGDAPGRPEVITEFLSNLRGSLPAGTGGPSGPGGGPGAPGQESPGQDYSQGQGLDQGQGQSSGQGSGQGSGGN